MTISKKLFMATIVVFGMQYAVPAFSYETYNAAELKAEVSQILDGIQELRKQNSSEAKKAAKWLEKAINGKCSISNTDIILIAKTVSSPLIIDAKIAVILKIMADISDTQAKQEKHHLKSTEKWYIAQLREKVLAGCACGGLIAFCTVAAYNDIVAAIKRHDNQLLSKVQEMISHQVAGNNAYLSHDHK